LQELDNQTNRQRIAVARHDESSVGKGKVRSMHPTCSVIHLGDYRCIQGGLGLSSSQYIDSSKILGIFECFHDWQDP